MPLKGTLSGSYASYVNLSNGNYANPATVTGTISLVSPTVALGASSAWSVVNAGSILSPGTSAAVGVRLLGGGSVENRAGGTIESYVGVSIYGSGTVTNAAGGFIAGGAEGFASTTAPPRRNSSSTPAPSAAPATSASISRPASARSPILAPA